MLYLHLFFATYATVPFASFLVRPGTPRLAGFAIMVPNSFIACAFAFATIEPYAGLPAVSVVTLAYAAVFLAMTTVLFRRGAPSLPAAVMNLGMAMVFLIATVPILFSRHWITGFWAAQSVVLIWVGLYLASRWLYGGGLALLAVTLGKVYFFDYWAIFTGPWSEQAIERLVITGLVLACLWQSKSLLARYRGPLAIGKQTAAIVLVSTFLVLLFATLNIELIRVTQEFHERATVAALSVLWAVYALSLMAVGFVLRVAGYRRVAIGLFAVTVLKVFFVDMANVATPFRILSFIGLGVLLIVASYLYYRFGERLGHPPSPPLPPFGGRE